MDRASSESESAGPGASGGLPSQWSGQVRYITRPKSEAMRVTRQLGLLSPRYRRVCIQLLSKRSICHNTAFQMTIRLPVAVH
jgi:hypothetical protein